MGVARQVAEEVIAAMEDHDLDRVYSLLAENFIFHDPSSPRGPMNADEWLGSNANLLQAFPDFQFNFEIEGEEGNQVWVSTRMQGTHSGDWDLTAMGAGVIPSTGRQVASGKSTTLGTINNQGQIESIEVVEQEENAGMLALLQQIGVDLG